MTPAPIGAKMPPIRPGRVRRQKTSSQAITLALNIITIAEAPWNNRGAGNMERRRRAWKWPVRPSHGKRRGSLGPTAYSAVAVTEAVFGNFDKAGRVPS